MTTEQNIESIKETFSFESESQYNDFSEMAEEFLMREEFKKIFSKKSKEEDQ